MVLPANCESNVMYYFHSDHLGSSSFLTDASGVAYQFLLYLPWGESFVEQKAAQFSTPYQFNGKELDGETGLYNYGARYYDPSLSLWLGVDPLADKMPGLSSYNYVMNNPVRLVDPDGRFPIDPTFRNSYPMLTNYIEKGLQSYFERNDNVLTVLSKYSTGDLNLSQIGKDFSPNSGPELRVGNSEDAFNGYYDKTTNSITFNPEFLNNIENLLKKGGEKSTYGKFDFIELFIEEYIHYGDALDGMDLELSADGVLFNNPYSQEPCAPGCKFDEGDAGTGEIFKYGRNGRMYYNLFKSGVLTYPNNDEIIETNPELINPSMIPE